MENNQTAENVIETKDLTLAFGEDVAVQSLTIYVPRGKIFAFIASSGCGKTTT